MINKISRSLLSLTTILTTVLFFLVQSAHGERPVAVIVARAQLGTIEDRVEALGTLRAREAINVTAAVTDTITRVNFEDGERVETGHILVEMTNAEEHALLEEELSTFEESEKQLERLMQLVKKEAVAESQLDQQRRDYEAAKARLRQVESRLKDRLIIAPFSGIVGLRNISVGALVEPGDLITTLDDDSTMKLDFPVPATFLESLQPGLAIEARAPTYANRAFLGTIASIDSRVDPITRSITARALLENNEQLLKPGMLMRVQLLKNPRKSIIIPEEAIIPVGNSTFVFKVNDSENAQSVEKIQVKTGGRRTGEVEIVEGLHPNDLVVVHGGLRLRPGATVTIRAVDDGSRTVGEMLQTQNGG